MCCTHSLPLTLQHVLLASLRSDVGSWDQLTTHQARVDPHLCPDLPDRRKDRTLPGKREAHLCRQAQRPVGGGGGCLLGPRLHRAVCTE